MCPSHEVHPPWTMGNVRAAEHASATRLVGTVMRQCVMCRSCVSTHLYDTVPRPSLAPEREPRSAPARGLRHGSPQPPSPPFRPSAQRSISSLGGAPAGCPSTTTAWASATGTCSSCEASEPGGAWPASTATSTGTPAWPHAAKQLASWAAPDRGSRAALRAPSGRSSCPGAHGGPPCARARAPRAVGGQLRRCQGRRV